MPSGKTHDTITFILTIPIFVVFWMIFDFVSAVVVITAFLFGGLMFGPDLDTNSTQYSRWGIFRFLWFPYKQIFKHRSSWSHGLIFGTLIRVVYFVGIITVVSFLITFGAATYFGDQVPNLVEFTAMWKEIGKYMESILGKHGLYMVFVGLWLGAASHTLTDMGGSYLQTGKVKNFL